MKRVLITGAGSYVGGWVRHRLEREPERFYVEELDVRGDTWRAFDFSNWDAVYHVAGIAHVRESTLSKGDYMSANRDLAVEVGKRARAAGVRQLLFMSTAAVYAASDAVHGVTPSTVPAPETWYGESKLEAEEGLFALECNGFRVVILRCPMIYGPGCRGNFPRLVSIARNLPVFPRVSNRRSALHVDNIAEFVAIAIDRELGGIFWPQDGEYMDTARAVSVLRRPWVDVPSWFRSSPRQSVSPLGTWGLLARRLVTSGSIWKLALLWSITSIELFRSRRMPRGAFSGWTARDENPRRLAVPPVRAVSGRRHLREAFVERSHEVTVLAGLPNCPFDRVPDVYRRGHCRRQERSVVRIERVSLAARLGDPVHLAPNYHPFAFNAWRRVPGIDDGFDAVDVYGMPSVIQTVSAQRYKRLLGSPVLLCCLDLWTLTMKVVLGDRLPRFVAAYRHLSGAICPGVDEIAVQSSSFPDEIAGLPGLPHVNDGPAYRTAKHVFNVVSCLCAFVARAIPVGVLAFKERIRCIGAASLAVRPGIVCLAQVEGGYELLPKEKVLLDIMYIENRGFAVDFSLIWRRLRTMATGEGAR